MELNQATSIHIHLHMSNRCHIYQVSDFNSNSIDQWSLIISIISDFILTSLIISWTWLSVGFWPIDLRTAVSSYMFNWEWCGWLDVICFQPWPVCVLYYLCQSPERLLSTVQKGRDTPSKGSAFIKKKLLQLSCKILSLSLNIFLQQVASKEIGWSISLLYL